jgi:site-specific DNA-methyltransferase (adenine-specific)
MTVTIKLWNGDCVARLAELEAGSIGAVICDPPYDLISASGKGSQDTSVAKGFMGKAWDATGIAFDATFWGLVHEVLLPGGVVKAFGGTRTFHKMCRAMEQAGFVDVHLEAWTYGSGFPKSTNISKQIDRSAGAEREVVGYKRGVGGENMNDIVHGREVRQTTDQGGKGVGAYGTGAKQVAVDVPVTKAATDAAKLWEGYGTALKPAWEPIVVGRKAG